MVKVGVRATIYWKIAMETDRKGGRNHWERFATYFRVGNCPQKTTFLKSMRQSVVTQIT